MTTLPTIAILGAGSMGGAILRGLSGPGVSVHGGIRVTNRTESKAALLRTEGVLSLSLEAHPLANQQAVVGARIVILGVKPAMVPDLLRDIAASLLPDSIVISVAAGVSTTTMQAIVPGVVLRAMPNTPALIGRAVTGLSAGSRATEHDVHLAKKVFETVGTVLELAESKIDALSTISGSGPAYVFYLIEQLTATAVSMGFTADEARIMVHGTFAGAVELLISSAETTAELRRRVTSPNGTTERAIAVLESAGLGDLFGRATAAALTRARELAEG